MSNISLIADIITLSMIVIDNIRCQNYSDAAIGEKRIIAMMFELTRAFSIDVEEQFKLLLIEMMNAQEREDEILFADILELKLIPFLSDYQVGMVGDASVIYDESVYKNNIEILKKSNNKLATIVENNLEWDNDVFIEYTSSGYLTAKIVFDDKELYLHSNANPKIEGQKMAKEYYDIDVDDYIVYGLGLGYHIDALLDIDDGINLEIFEPRLEVICTAFHYVDMCRILSRKGATLIYDPDYTQMGKMINDKKKMIIHYPTLKATEDTDIRLVLEKYFIHESGVRKYTAIFKNNFRENIKNINHYVDELKLRFVNKNAIMVAAGPSLDKNIDLLKKKPPGIIIVAVGTVFRKLVDEGIIPDYVVVLDAQKHTAKQFDGMYDMDVPIIIASTAVKEVGIKYKGNKYLVCQTGYDKAEKYAEAHNYTLYETGGSVSTIALDICIRLGCNEIACVGLDLAYTDGKTHSNNTNYYKEIDEEGEYIDVRSVTGGLVKSSRVFIMYREWMEKRASFNDAKGKLIDATEGGALIEGFRIENLRSVMKRFSMHENEKNFANINYI